MLWCDSYKQLNHLIQDTDLWIRSDQVDSELGTTQSDSEESPPNSPCGISLESDHEDSPAPPSITHFTIESMEEAGEICFTIPLSSF